MPVTKIDAAEKPEKPLRVAAYCRVSTMMDMQQSSIENQEEHYKAVIVAHPSWTAAGIYIDEGLTGTKKEIRPELNRMLDDCRAGKIDLVLTKSISRFARNALDCLEMTREMTGLGVDILFEKESINTMDARGEVLITIMSSLAQQESDSISRNVRMGIQYHMQQGQRDFNSNNIFGYSKDKVTGLSSIDPAEAETVRRIYRSYLEGYSLGMIARKLTADGIKTPGGKDVWQQTTINSILTSEKYCGDFLMQKYYTTDFLTHKQVRNTGQLPQYFVKDDHDPIVPREVFYQVQGEILRRRNTVKDPTKLRFGSTMALSGRLFCGICGRALKRFASENPADVDWRCRNRSYKKKKYCQENHAKCRCRNVPEMEVKRAVVEAFNMLPERRDELIRLQGALRDGDLRGYDRNIESVREQRKRMKERLQLSSADKEEDGETAFLEGEISRLDDEEKKLLLERADAAGREVRVRLLLEFIDGPVSTEEIETPSCSDYEDFFRRTRYVPEPGLIGRDGRVMHFSDDLMIRFVEKIIVTDEGYEVHFKAGIVAEVPISYSFHTL